MPSVTLYRVDPSRNMSRFYRLTIQPDLFGNLCFLCEWGRIGRSSRMQITPYQTEGEALLAFHKQRKRKERRGYTGR
jgi:predicted DNA-binding WGR domain protein